MGNSLTRVMKCIKHNFSSVLEVDLIILLTLEILLILKRNTKIENKKYLSAEQFTRKILIAL